MSRLSVLERIVLLLGLTKFENTKCRWQFDTMLADGQFHIKYLMPSVVEMVSCCCLLRVK